MENLIIILSMLLNIALIIALAVYIKRFNKVSEDYKKCVNEYDKLDKMYDSKCIELIESRELTYSTNKKLLELNKEIEDHIITMDERQKQIVELIQKCNRQNAEIESLQSINSTLLNDNRKLSEIKKPIQKIVPDELINQTNLASQILKGLDVYSEKYPKDAIEFFTKIIESINETIKELKKPKHKKVSQK